MQKLGTMKNINFSDEIEERRQVAIQKDDEYKKSVTVNIENDDDINGPIKLKVGDTFTNP